MKLAWLVLTIATAVAGQSETILKASRVKHVLVVDQVFLNGVGPFRMMIDTGNASSLIRPKVAQRLDARAKYRVRQVTINGTEILPVVVLDEVKAGDIADRGVEAMVGDIALDGVDGVLGQSWLVRHDYLLDYRNRRVVIDGESPQRGARAALRSTDGRPMLAAEVDGRQGELILDSGAPLVVLFEPEGHSATRPALRTNAFVTHAEPTWSRIAIAGEPARRMEAIRVNPSGLTQGLLPACAFASVFVSNRHGIIELVR